VLLAAIGLIVSLCAVSTAFSVQHHPKRDFAVFADCPLSDPAVELCLVASITHGELTIGRRTVPINKAIAVQGGAIEKGEGPLTFVAAEDGNTLSKTALSVPGGLLGIGGPARTTEATVTLELAGPASTIELDTNHLLGEHGTALRLAVKAKLSNPLLPSNCYVGSNSSPLVLDFTTGTTSPPPPNKPIGGEVGSLETREKGEIVGLRDGLLVDNAFPAPRVSGCGGFYSSLASADLGLPSPAGRNTAILAGKFELVSARAVKASE
jgi:hypothetical protein